MFHLLSACAVAAAVPQMDKPLKVLNMDAMIKEHTQLHMTNLMAQKQKHVEAGGFPQKKMVGTFITPCENFNCLVEDSPYLTVPCSSAAAERIESDNTVVTDLTFYVRDYGCRPNNTDILAKIVIYSDVEYGASSPVPGNEGGKQITYTPSKTSLLFQYQPDDIGMIKELNDFCPCGGNWTAGVQRMIHPHQCSASNEQKINRTFSGDLCHFAFGDPMYQTILWVDYTHYIQSFGSFDKLEGWSEHMDHRLVNTLLPESGSTNPNDCGLEAYSKCKGAVTNGINTCDSCNTTLECEQCLWYFMPSQLGKTNEWNECCPRLYYKAQNPSPQPKHSLDWLKVNC